MNAMYADLRIQQAISQAVCSPPHPCQSLPVCRSRRTHRRVVARCTANDDEPPEIYDDWRTFRAQLLAAERRERSASAEPESTATATQSQISESNMTLLSIQSPALASEDVWAHATPRVEVGGILLATLKTAEILDNDGLEEAVILMTQHGPKGSIGLLINKPTPLMLGTQRGGLRFAIQNAAPEVQQVFGESRVYTGGWTAQQMVHMMHPYPLPKSVQVVPGIYLGGDVAAAHQVGTGKLSPDNFKFYMGAMVWEPGQLEREITAGCWCSAACSRNLVLKQCIQLPTPLWREIMLLMGGEYAAIAAEAYEGDEVSGE